VNSTGNEHLRDDKSQWEHDDLANVATGALARENLIIQQYYFVTMRQLVLIFILFKAKYNQIFTQRQYNAAVYDLWLLEGKITEL
jgi:hypothetical protein